MRLLIRVVGEYRDAIKNALWSKLSQSSQRGLSNHRNNSSSHVVVSHSGANLEADHMNQVSLVDRTVHLKLYCSGNDRFQIADGVRILADFAQVGKPIILSTS